MASKGKIIVINDMPNMSERLVRWLAKEKYHASFVATGELAQALLERDHFDAIVYGHEFLFSPRFSSFLSQTRGKV